jgi:hypothetical protein
MTNKEETVNVDEMAHQETNDIPTVNSLKEEDKPKKPSQKKEAKKESVKVDTPIEAPKVVEPVIEAKTEEPVKVVAEPEKSKPIAKGDRGHDTWYQLSKKYLTDKELIKLNELLNAWGMKHSDPFVVWLAVTLRYENLYENTPSHLTHIFEKLSNETAKKFIGDLQEVLANDFEDVVVQANNKVVNRLEGTQTALNDFNKVIKEGCDNITVSLNSVSPEHKKSMAKLVEDIRSDMKDETNSYFREIDKKADRINSKLTAVETNTSSFTEMKLKIADYAIALSVSLSVVGLFVGMYIGKTFLGS